METPIVRIFLGLDVKDGSVIKDEVSIVEAKRCSKEKTVSLRM